MLPFGIIGLISRTKLQVRRDHHGNKKAYQETTPTPAGKWRHNNEYEYEENKNKMDIRPGKQTEKRCAANDIGNSSSS
jgi:hypothetical protein